MSEGRGTNAPTARCNRRDCNEPVSVPSRPGYRGWEPCAPGEETGMCARHAARPLTPDEEAKARRALDELIAHVASSTDT